MHTVMTCRVLPALVFCSLFMPAGTGAETLRDRSDRHFGSLEWISGNKATDREISGSNVPGGNETFPLLGRMQVEQAGDLTGALYPRETRLGILDYRDADPALISLLQSVSAALLGSKLDAGLCDPSRPFLPVIAAFQLAKLPPVSDVLFSAPSAPSISSTDAEKPMSILFRLQCMRENSLVPVYLSVTAAQSGSLWKLTEFMFDAETYAGLAQSH